jgi:uncharacterized protein (TIGR02597 family)
MMLTVLSGEDVTTEPTGFNKVTCLANSDTIVSVPLRVKGGIRRALTAAPAISGDSATLTLTPDSFSPGAFTKHYLKFITGDREGRWYDIQTSANNGTPNTAAAVTINLNGDTLGGATTGDSVLIAEYWTLDTLFPPTGATSSWSGIPPVPDGHAIVASTNALNRKTEVLLPNLSGVGINISFSSTYYLTTGTSGTWKKVGDTSKPSFGDTILYPDNYFIIRHNSSVINPTVFKMVGEVEMQSMTIPLLSQSSGKQDNFIGLPRPVDVSLLNLALDGVSFVNSANALNRKDELLVFNNALVGKNKSASATYYRLATGNSWRKVGDSTTVQDNTVIPAGSGFIIRKASIAPAGTAMWQNPSPY